MASLNEKVVNDIVAGQFDVAFQPIVGREEFNTMVFCEALIRPRGGISPIKAVNIAEKYGVSDYLFINMLRKAIRPALIRNLECSTVGSRISINVSPYHINEARSADEFIDGVLRCISLLHISPYNVALEITESAAIQNYTKANKIVRELSRNGIIIMADDFGCGSSNFELLSKVPDIRAVKLSRDSIIDYSKLKRGSVSWVRAVNSLKDQDGYIIICEGIDNDTARCLNYINCDYVQGFKFGKPQTLNGIIGLMNKQSFRLGA